jgi:hypothetical protein
MMMPIITNNGLKITIMVPTNSSRAPLEYQAEGGWDGLRQAAQTRRRDLQYTDTNVDELYSATKSCSVNGQLESFLYLTMSYVTLRKRNA